MSEFAPSASTVYSEVAIFLYLKYRWMNILAFDPVRAVWVFGALSESYNLNWVIEITRVTFSAIWPEVALPGFAREQGIHQSLGIVLEEY